MKMVLTMIKTYVQVILIHIFLTHTSAQITSPISNAVINRSDPIKHFILEDGLLYIRGIENGYIVNPIGLNVTKRVTSSSASGSQPTYWKRVEKTKDEIFDCESNSNTCWIRKLSDLSVIGSRHDGVGADAPKISGGSTVNRMIVLSITYQGNKPAFFFLVSPPVTRGLSFRDPVSFDVISQQDPIDFTRGQVPMERFYADPESAILEFFDVVSYGNFQYIIKNSLNDPRNPARIASICAENDLQFNSHTEIAVDCGSGYNYMQAVFVSSVLGGDLKKNPEVSSNGQNEIYIFAVVGHSRTTQDTKLCVQRVSELEEKFQDTYKKCREGTDVSIFYGPPELSTNGSCESTGTTGLSICGSDSASNDAVYNPTPLHMTEVIGLNFTATSMKMLFENRYSVAVMTDAGSSIYQVLLGTSKKGVYRRQVISGVTTPLVRQIEILDSKMYVISNTTLFKRDLYSCSSAMTCGDCTALKDPFCGWCALSQRCTTSSECPWENETDHWLQEQCINSELADTTMSTELKDGQIPRHTFEIYADILPKPTADMTAYRCCFDFSESVETCVEAKKYPEGSRFYIECKSPANIRELLSFKYERSVTRPLRVVLGNHAFIEKEITYFDCSAYTTCTTCVSVHNEEDNHDCRWFTNKSTCTSQTPTNYDGVISNQYDMPREKAGENFCPRIKPIDSLKKEVLIPSGTDPQVGGYKIRFQALAVQPDAMLHCVLSWAPNVTKVFAAVQEQESSTKYYTCGITQALNYSSDNGTQPIKFRVRVGNAERYLDNPENISVLMYKCKAMTDNCGECLRLPLQYRCGWCIPPASTPTCSLSTLCKSVSSDEIPLFITTESLQQCPDNTIKSFNPYAGPTNGLTTITINGKNLGRTIDDNRLSDYVYIGDPSETGSVPCVVNKTATDLPSKIVCETRGSSAPLEDAIYIKLTQQAQSSQNFRFLEPLIQGIQPAKGPKAGGTKVIIYGTNVNIGSTRKIVMKYLDNFSSWSTRQLNEAAVERRGLNQTVFYTDQLPTDINSSNKKVRISYIIDGYTSSEYDFSYLPNANITQVVPLKGILSGGTSVTVTGTNLDVVAKPLMYIRSSTTSRRRRAVPEIPAHTGECNLNNNELMTCEVPSLSAVEEGGEYEFGFVMDGQTNTRDLSNKIGFSKFRVVGDPIFNKTDTPILVSPDQEQIAISIKGEGILTIGDEAIVRPMITIELEPDPEKGKNILYCAVISVSDAVITCDLQTKGLIENIDYTTKIRYGSELTAEVGTVRKNVTPALSDLHIGIIVGSAVLIVLIVIIVISVLVRKDRKNQQNVLKLQSQMDSLELRVAKECKEAFAELQTDMNEMTHDIANLHGLPFYSYQRYAMKALFPTSPETDHAVVRRLEILDRRETVERGLKEFGKLINTKTFLLMFVRTLESQRTFHQRDKVDVASLISVALQEKMEYHTDILKRLLEELIEKSIISKKDPRILLRRSESVAEKMLSNWFTFLLHKFLKECAGEPLYLLYRAIKQQIDKGPVDHVTSDARYSLSEDKLLRQHVDFNRITLRLQNIDPHSSGEPTLIRVLSCDTISQVLDKILDTLYRNVPYSNNQRAKKEELMIEWIKYNGERMPLYDDDPNISRIEGDFKKIATLADYHIQDQATVCLVHKTEYNSLDNGHYQKSTLSKFDSSQTSNGSPSSSLPRINSTNNILADNSSRRIHSFHLVKHDPETQHLDSDRNKMVSEVYLTRLLSTKGTLQQFVDDLFETIFSTAHRGSALPLAIKHMFDFLDDQASHHNITDPEVIHKWKSNSLPLRFWVNVIKNPDFVFDIHKSDIVDSCLSVVAQIFMESCSRSGQRLDKDSPSSKLLYAKEIPRYKNWVQRYYADVKSMPAISDQDMAAILAEESKQQTGVFNTTAAYYELYQYSLKYDQELLSALDMDEFARRDNLKHRLTNVNSMLNFHHRI